MVQEVGAHPFRFDRQAQKEHTCTCVCVACIPHACVHKTHPSFSGASSQGIHVLGLLDHACYDKARLACPFPSPECLGQGCTGTASQTASCPNIRGTCMKDQNVSRLARAARKVACIHMKSSLKAHSHGQAISEHACCLRLCATHCCTCGSS